MIETRERPPLCNTGASGLRWDWYQATIRGGSESVTSGNAVMWRLLAVAEDGGRWRPVRPLYGYTSGAELLGVLVGSVRVFWGGEDVHVQATGAVADTVAEVLREEWPDHIVSRADVAHDVVEAGGFERMWRRVHTLARENPRGKVSTSTAGDWIDGELGRTFYAGGTGSRLRVRVYEKGHEQRAKDPGCGADLNWVRVEWQLRPTSNQKAWLARASKVEALGLSAFGAAVAADLLGSDVVAIGNVLRFASQDPAYWMVKQYRRVVLALVELDPDDIRDRLAELLEQTEAVR